MVSLNILFHIIFGTSSVVLGLLIIIFGAINAGRFGDSRITKKIFKFHKYFSIILGIIVIFSFFGGISSLLIEGHEIFQSIHSWTGLSIVIISIIQIISSLTITDRKKLRNIHKYAGYILLIVISIQLITGIFQATQHLLE